MKNEGVRENLGGIGKKRGSMMDSCSSSEPAFWKRIRKRGGTSKPKRGMMIYCGQTTPKKRGKAGESLNSRGAQRKAVVKSFDDLGETNTFEVSSKTVTR